jgi:hypothetical protein
VLGITHTIAEKQLLSYNIDVNEHVEHLMIRCCEDDYFESDNIINYPTTPGYTSSIIRVRSCQDTENTVVYRLIITDAFLQGSSIIEPALKNTKMCW